MSNKAVGFDWKKRKFPTLRHAAAKEGTNGAKKYLYPKRRSKKSSSSSTSTQTTCIAKLKSGERSGEQCGCKAKYPENDPKYCGRHKRNV